MSCDQLLKPDAAAVSEAATSVRSDQKSEGWSPPQVTPTACWPVQPGRPNSTPSPGCTSSSARCIERRYFNPWPQAERAPDVPSAKRASSGMYQPSPSSALMPCTPRRRTFLACSRHHSSAIGFVKSTGEPVPIHHFATSGSSEPSRTNIDGL